MPSEFYNAGGGMSTKYGDRLWRRRACRVPPPLGRPHGPCYLHSLGTVLVCMLGLRQKDPPSCLVPVLALMKKVYALAAHFHVGDHVQRVAEHKHTQQDIHALAAAAKILSSGLWDPATNTADEANKIDSFLDPNDPCPEETAEKERVATHVTARRGAGRRSTRRARSTTCARRTTRTSMRTRTRPTRT